jgi:hypothetical protein
VTPVGRELDEAVMKVMGHISRRWQVLPYSTQLCSLTDEMLTWLQHPVTIEVWQRGVTHDRPGASATILDSPVPIREVTGATIPEALCRLVLAVAEQEAS